MSVEALHERSICEEETTLAAKFAGMLGAWVSSGALVVALTAPLWADAFPAASYAATV